MNNIIPSIWLGEYGFKGRISLKIENKEKEYDLNIETNMSTSQPKVLNEQIKAYHYLIENQHLIYNKILEIVFKAYPSIKEEYEQFSDVMGSTPTINTIGELKNNVKLIQVHIMDIHKDGQAFVGFEFDCTWDEEHGLGVMTHKSEILEMGEADISFLDWVAEQYLD